MIGCFSARSRRNAPAAGCRARETPDAAINSPLSDGALKVVARGRKEDVITDAFPLPTVPTA